MKMREARTARSFFHRPQNLGQKTSGRFYFFFRANRGRSAIRESAIMMGRIRIEALNPKFSVAKPNEKLNIMSSMLARLTTAVVTLDAYLLLTNRRE